MGLMGFLFSFCTQKSSNIFSEGLFTQLLYCITTGLRENPSSTVGHEAFPEDEAAFCKLELQSKYKLMIIFVNMHVKYKHCQSGG